MNLFASVATLNVYFGTTSPTVRDLCGPRCGQVLLVHALFGDDAVADNLR